MAGLLTIVAAVLVISILSSTREGRAEARERMKRWARPLIPAAVALWLFIIWCLWSAPRR